MKVTLCVFAVLAAAAVAAEKPRVFITESGATQVSGEAAVEKVKGSLSFTGGNSPQSIEVMKAFSKQCPEVLVTSNREKADFVVRFDHEDLSPATPFSHGNKVAIFNRGEDLVYSSSTRLLSSAVKGACAVIKSGR